MNVHLPMITVISGSPRADSVSSKLAVVVADLIERHTLAGGVTVLDLAKAQLPMRNDDQDCGSTSEWRQWDAVSELLVRADGYVMIVPEWGGMSPPAVKNLFLLCDGTFQLADKPALLVGISSGHGGSYPLAELRMSSYKNTRICYIPEQVVIQEVNSVLDSASFTFMHAARQLEARLTHALVLLVHYAIALGTVRNHNRRDVVQFRWGM